MVSIQVFSFSIFTGLLLEAILLFSPLIYGSITIFPLSIIEAGSFLIFLFYIFGLLAKEKIALVRLSFLPLILFLVLVFFQFLPLPNFLLNILSPATVQLYHKFSFTTSSWQSLSVCPESGLKMLLQILSFFVLFIVAINYLDSEEKIKRIAIVIVTAGFLFSLYGIIRKLTNPGIGRSFPPFANGNHFAAYLEMIIPLAIALALVVRFKSVRLIFIFIASVMTLALFFTASRAGIASFLISFIGILLILSFKVSIKKTAVVFLISILIFSAFFLSADTKPIFERINWFLADPLGAYGGRLNLITDSMRIVMDFPFLGTGLGTFGDIYQKYKTIGGQDYVTRSSFAHNEPVQLLVETGLIGFLLFFSFLVLLLKKSIFAWLGRKNTFVIYMAAGCFVSIAAAIFHSFLDFTLHIPANAILFFVILAVLYRIVHLKSPNPVNNSLIYNEFKLGKASRIILACISLLGFLFTESLIIKRYQAETLVNNIDDNKEGSGGINRIFAYKKDIKAIDMAILFNPLNSNYYRRKADIFWKLTLQDDFDNNLATLAIGASREECLISAAGLYKKAIMLNPANSEFHFQLGSLMASLGERDLTAEEYKKALTLHPTNFKLEKYVKEYLAKQF